MHTVICEKFATGSSLLSLAFSLSGFGRSVDSIRVSSTVVV